MQPCSINPQRRDSLDDLMKAYVNTLRASFSGSEYAPPPILAATEHAESTELVATSTLACPTPGRQEEELPSNDDHGRRLLEKHTASVEFSDVEEKDDSEGGLAQSTNLEADEEEHVASSSDTPSQAAPSDVMADSYEFLERPQSLITELTCPHSVAPNDGDVPAKTALLFSAAGPTSLLAPTFPKAAASTAVPATGGDGSAVDCGPHARHMRLMHLGLVIALLGLCSLTLALWFLWREHAALHEQLHELLAKRQQPSLFFRTTGAIADYLTANRRPALL